MGSLYLFFLGNNSIQTNRSTVPSITPSPMQPHVEDQVLLKFKKGVSEQEIESSLRSYNVTILKKIPAVHIFVVKVPRGLENEMLYIFKKDNLIDTAEPDYLNKFFLHRMITI